MIHILLAAAFLLIAQPLSAMELEADTTTQIISCSSIFMSLTGDLPKDLRSELSQKLALAFQQGTSIEPVEKRVEEDMTEYEAGGKVPEAEEGAEQIQALGLAMQTLNINYTPEQLIHYTQAYAWLLRNNMLSNYLLRRIQAARIRAACFSSESYYG